MQEIKSRTLNHFAFYCFDNIVLASLLTAAASLLWNANNAGQGAFYVSMSKTFLLFAGSVLAVKFLTDFWRARAVAEFEFINGLRFRGDRRHLRPWHRYRHTPSITERIFHRIGQLWQQQKTA